MASAICHTIADELLRDRAGQHVTHDDFLDYIDTTYRRHTKRAPAMGSYATIHGLCEQAGITYGADGTFIFPAADDHNQEG